VWIRLEDPDVLPYYVAVLGIAGAVLSDAGAARKLA